MDLTARFTALVNENPSSSQIRPHVKGPHNPFLITSIRLNDDVGSLASQVALFRADTSRLAFTTVEKAGAAISAGAEKLKRRFEELESAVKTLNEAVKVTNLGGQNRQHLERIVMTLEQRLQAIGKDFQTTLQEAARKLAARQERVRSTYGEYNYAPAAASLVKNVSATRPFPSSSPPPHSGQSSTYGTTHSGHQVSPNPALQSDPFQHAIPANSLPNAPLLNSMNGNHTTKPSINNIPPAMPMGATNTAMNMRHRTSAIQAAPLFVPHPDEMQSSSYDQQQMQPQMMVRRRDKLEVQRGRLQDVEKVEKTIGELSQMFIRVAGLVKEHEEMINDIEANVDDSAAYTNVAQMELMKLFKFVSSDRGLIIKMLIATLLFGMLIIYFYT